MRPKASAQSWELGVTVLSFTGEEAELGKTDLLAPAPVRE